MMSSMHEELARALVEARLATARQQQLVRDARKSRRAAGKAESTARAPGIGRITLETLLDRTAERIVEAGTRSESATLCAMSTATRHLAPGAAAALTDWDGSEPARLRAFGIVHGVVLRGLEAGERSRLLDRLTGPGEREVRPVAEVEAQQDAA